ARAAVLAVSADADLARRTGLGLATRLDADAAGHVACRAGLAGAAHVVARRLAGAVLADATGRTGDAVACRDASADPTGLPVRTRHAVAAADAGPALAHLIGAAGLADARVILAKPVGVAGEADGARELGVVARVAADALTADLAGRAQVAAVVDHAVAVV